MPQLHKYEGQYITVTINLETKQTIVEFNILGYTLQIRDKTETRGSSATGDVIAKKIHDNIMVDGTLIRQIKQLLKKQYAYKLWRFI